MRNCWRNQCSKQLWPDGFILNVKLKRRNRLVISLDSANFLDFMFYLLSLVFFRLVILGN